MIRRSAPVALALATVVAAAAWAAIMPQRVLDPNDTPGRLDVRVVRFEDPPGTGPEWTVITFDPWTVGQMWDRGWVYLLLDTRGDEAADHLVVVRSDGRRLLGSLWRVATGTGRDRYLRAVAAEKVGERAAWVRLPLRALTFGPSRTFYRWWVQTWWECEGRCADRAPDVGSELTYRPGMSPSPSPSPSPEPPPEP
ncbi:MAG: hypothetical protein KatS3mg013_1558 [Actinomycetota bacterium]|nr:MAG: hypothetical protein KatS3mg013_1558 [Actinomycetota bacterium]